MWPFKNVNSLRKSGMFEGFVDWHSHILPGVDDGIKTFDEAIDVLNAYEALGVKKVWLTPHIMEDYPNTTVDLIRQYGLLKEQWYGSLEICLASENMLDSLFEERLESKDFLPIGEDGRYLLVETSYYTPPFGMDDMLEGIKAAGYFPLLAHPERYRYMDEKDYIRLKDSGILFQVNFVSLTGGYGEGAQKKAEWLFSKGMVDVVGSDIHRLLSIQGAIEKSPRKGDYLKSIQQLSNNYL